MRRLFLAIILFIMTLGSSIAFVVTEQPEPPLPSSNPQIEPATTLEQGIAFDLDWHPDGEVLAIAATTGIWFLDADLNIIELKLEQSADTPQIIEWNPSGDYLAIFYISGRLIILRDDDFGIEFDEYISEVSPIRNLKRSINWHPLEKKLSVASHIVDIDAKTSTKPHIYDVAAWRSDGKKVVYGQGQTGDVVWSPDGKSYISIDYRLSGCSPTCTNYAIYDAESREYIRDLYFGVNWANFLWKPGFPIYASNIQFEGDIVYNPDANAVAYIEIPAFSPGTPYKLRIATLRHHTDTTEDMTLVRDSDDLEHFEGLRPQNYSAPPYRVDWFPKGGNYVTIIAGNHIAMIDIHTMQVVKSRMLSMPGQAVLEWSPDMSHIALVSPGAYEFPLQIWDITKYPYQLRQMFNHELQALPNYAVRSGDFHVAELNWQDMDRLLVAEKPRPIYEQLRSERFHHEVAVWNPFTGEKTDIIAQESIMYPGLNELSTYVYNDDYTVMAQYRPHKRGIRFIDPRTMSGIGNIYVPEEDYLNSVSISPNKQVVATDSAVWEITTGRKLYDLDSYISIAWSPDGWLFAKIGLSDITIYETASSELIDRYNVPSLIESIQWSPNGRYLAVLHQGTLSFIDRLNPEILVTINGSYHTFTWSPDGKRIAFYTTNREIEIRNADEFLDRFDEVED